MKKVFLKCICYSNLGDDLFIKTLCSRYSNNFYFSVSKKCNTDFYLKNLRLIKLSSLVYKCLRKFEKLAKSINPLDKFILNKCDIIVSIGGSIFMENKTGKVYYPSEWYLKVNKPYYIVGANIGPVYSDKYIEDVRKVLRNSVDSCLRDEYSYNICKDLSNVRYAPDIIFSLPVKKYINNEENTVIFSLIDSYKKSVQMKNPNPENYEKLIIDLIHFYQEKKFKIKLFSFCKDEGDEDAINRIYEQLSDKNNVSKYFYTGNIEEALDVFSKSKVVIGTRFHANVLGLIMNKVVIPIIYNDKTKNLLVDINFKGVIYDINDLNNYNGLNLDSKKISYRCDVSKQVKESEKHFQKLDSILKRVDLHENR